MHESATIHLITQAPPGTIAHLTARVSMLNSDCPEAYGIDIPIDKSYPPNVDFQVEIVGAAERSGDDGKPDPKLAKRPAFATGSLGSAPELPEVSVRQIP